MVREGSVMKIIIILVRDDEAVYKEEERRIQGLFKPMEYGADRTSMWCPFCVTAIE